LEGLEPLGRAQNENVKYTALSTTGGCAVVESGDVHCENLDAPDAGTFTYSGPFFEVSGTGRFGCAVRADGSLSCWGPPYDPENPGVDVSLFTGPYREILVTRSGVVCALSKTNLVDCGIPGLKQLIRLDGEYTHLSSFEAACAVRSDGAPACVGSVAEAPSLVFSEVGVGEYTYPRCGVLIDGRLVCWDLPPGATFE
jgi:hypothetical protein